MSKVHSSSATHGECLPTPYKVDTHPTPLDTLAVFGKEECWYRIPSWRVHFDHDALRNADIRLHRAIGSHGVWTLTEATTGLKLHADMPHEFYIGDEGAMLAEFAAGRMLQLTPEKMQDAIAKGKEKVAQHSRCPFAPSETVPLEQILHCLYKLPHDPRLSLPPTDEAWNNALVAVSKQATGKDVAYPVSARAATDRVVWSVCHKHQGIPFTFTLEPAMPARQVCPHCEKEKS